MSFDVRKTRQTIFGQNTDFLIGELLVRAGIIKQNQLDEALKLAGNKHMQLGQMLIMARHISPRDLQVAIDAQSAVRDHVVEMNVALRALSTACRSGTSFAEALDMQSQEKAAVKPTNRLGELLLEAGLIDKDQLSKAMQKSLATGLPLGRMLVLNNVISEPILASALEVQIQLRDGTLSRPDALSRLRVLAGAKLIDTGTAQLEEAYLVHTNLPAPRKKGIRLGELFVLAGILSETDVMNALELSLVNEQPMGQVLVGNGYITNPLLDAAITLQALVDSSTLQCTQAGQCLGKVYSSGVTLAEAVEAVLSEFPDGSSMKFQDLLIERQLVSGENIETAFQLALVNPRVLVKVLEMTGYLDQHRCELTIECYDSIVNNRISKNEAYSVLDYCLQIIQERPITFDQALDEIQGTNSTESAQAPVAPPATAVTMATVDTVGIMHSAPADQSSFFTSQQLVDKPADFQGAPRPPGSKTGMTTGNIPTLTQLQSEADLLNQTLGQIKTTTTNQSSSPVSADQLSVTMAPSQTFVATTSASPSPSPSVVSQEELPVASLLPKQPPRSSRTGKTTGNIPALTQLQLGSELLRPISPATSASANQETSPPQPGASSSPSPSTSAVLSSLSPPSQSSSQRKTVSLKALLTGEHMAITHPGSNSQTPAAQVSSAPDVNSGANIKPPNSPNVAVDNTADTKNKNELELSENEKALIQAASSLTASPEDILTAMQLAAKKGKDVQSGEDDSSSER